MAKRLHMTSADYVAIAVSPALIMALVGSLVFFLIEVLYVGQYQARLSYAFGLFVFAAVLIARISIEMGSERAALFALPLGIAMFLVLLRFVEHPSPFSHLINLVLLGVVWWCAHQLTWDCTLIDDDQDASGEGLMQRIGFDKPVATDDDAPAAGTKSNELLEQSERYATAATSWWRRLVQARTGPHTPGLWVLYFSLAALPLFGIGQHWIPVSDVGRRRNAFFLLLVYVAAALALLVTTSFLGLRRYLRQRRIEMPAPIAATWVAFGAVLIALVMLVAALIPRPAAEVAISQVPWRAGSAHDLSATRNSFGNDATRQQDNGTVAREEPGDDDDDTNVSADSSQQGHGDSPVGVDPAADEHDGAHAKSDESSGDSVGQSSDGQSQPPSGRQGGQSSSSEQSARQQSAQQQTSGDSSTGDSDSGKTSGDAETQSENQSPESRDNEERSTADQSEPEQSQSPPSGQPGGGRPPKQTPISEPLQPVQNLSTSLGGLAGLLKLLFYAVAALLVVYLLWKYRHELSRAFADILRQLRELLAGLLGGTRPTEPGTVNSEAAPARIRVRSFAEFRDPFATGEHSRIPPDELVRYTFAAFEAWANDHGYPRTPDCTPHELARAAVPLHTPMSREVGRLVRLYSELAYASRPVSRESADELRELWYTMSHTQPAAVEMTATHRGNATIG